MAFITKEYGSSLLKASVDSILARCKVSGNIEYNTCLKANGVLYQY